MPEVVDWRRAQPNDVVLRAVEVLAGGGLAGFPTDTFYEIAGQLQLAQALARLQGADHAPLTLTLARPTDILQWQPDLGQVGLRLARRCWPGPMTLVHADMPKGQADRMSVECRLRLSHDGALGFRVPAHEAILQVIGRMPEVAVLAMRPTKFTSAAQLVAEWGHALGLVIDDGPTHFGRPPTTVRVDGERWQILAEGVLSADELAELASCRILFVCTGNTCRSPLAQALCSKLLADRLGCAAEELGGRGFIVQSAGLAAMMGAEAAAEAVAVAHDYGADLAGHRSQPLTQDLLEQADFLFAMTRSHLETLTSIAGTAAGPVPRLLSSAGEDVPDPIGGSAEVYRDCAERIQRHLQELLPELDRP